MTIKFNATTAPAYFYNGNNVEDVYLFANGEILAKFDHADIELSEIKGDRVEAVNRYDKELKAVNLSTVKRAKKFDLMRKDNFIVSTASTSYITRPYDLYIYAGQGGDVEIMSAIEYKHGSGFDGQQWYMMNYGIKFNKGVSVWVGHVERIVCDDYTLQDGEKFGEYYGTKEAKTVCLFDTSKYSLLKNREPQKGILKKWAEVVEMVGTFDIKGSRVSRVEKTAERIERENLAEEFSKITWVTVGEWQLKKFMDLYTITKKAEA